MSGAHQLLTGLCDAVPAKRSRYSDPKRGTRLGQLTEQWTNAGRPDPTDSAKREQKIAVLSTSMDSKVKISIDDLTDRIAMLTDVSGRVLLMKRDLAVLLRACSSSAGK